MFNKEEFEKKFCLKYTSLSNGKTVWISEDTPEAVWNWFQQQVSVEPVVKPANDLAYKHRADVVLNTLRDLEGWVLREDQMDAKTVNKVVKQIFNMKKQRENHLSV